MIRRPPRSTQSRSSAASDVYKRQISDCSDHLRNPSSSRPMISQLNYQNATLSSFGAQVHSTRRSGPLPGFGTSGHNPKVYISARHNADLFGVGSPGPANYMNESSWTPARLGRMVPSTSKSPPAFGFGSSSRFFQSHLTVKQPGPGKYNSQNIWSKDSLGSNVSSRHRSANKARIGTQVRFLSLIHI
eukprot:TRINITY_DN14310_c0_g1_i1.p1 TRINITY_DN14310_c0_g1~~TRINITY_DN14310_c0_g1_i1.p1  ORF type:complete len:188 (-),score=31.49 TRINITY_DN14310_c0_g1_i1:108-671(-)